MDDSDPEKWDYPPHTRAKHRIFGDYLDAWFPILASGFSRVLVLDGFAGRGRYTDGSPGSPIIALRRLLNHSFWPRMQHREFVFVFIEFDPDNVKSLRHELAEFRRAWVAEHGDWPANVKYDVREGTFETNARAIRDYLAEQKKALAPTFALIDPFGWTGLPMRLIGELLDHPSCEVFINFMVGNVNRFLTQPQQGDNMNELFDLDVDAILASHEAGGGTNRVEHLRDIYVQQLEKLGFTYVRAFAMHNKTGNVVYYLIHGTRNPRGVEKMKDAMYRIAPGGDFSFSDRMAGVEVLFGDSPNLQPLRATILGFPPGHYMVNPTLQEWVILNTPYRRPHLTQALRELEEAKTISVHRPPGKRQYSAGVTIEVLPRS